MNHPSPHQGQLVALTRRLNRTLPDARIEAVRLPGCAGLTLGLINADYQQGPLAPEIMHAVIKEPAYWAFCWGSGLALARFLLANPQWVAGRRVVDLGSGSGVAGIAAALAGAARVIACDSDPDAMAATRINAELNSVALTVVSELGAVGLDNDLLLMADVLYDRSNLPLLEAAAGHATEILVADSRVAELPDPAYREILALQALTCPNLGEFDEYRTARLFHYHRAAGNAVPPPPDLFRSRPGTA